jgi:hypothetical protein
MSVLGVPVDHRLRDIIRELMELNEAPTSSSPLSNHNEFLRQLSRTLHDRGWLILENEADFACYIAEPEVQGGIVVALTQPPGEQAYDIPKEKIVRDCNTLRALLELAEFFSLPFNRLSVFDAFPYITEQDLDPDNMDHSESHTTFYKMILEKRHSDYIDSLAVSIFQWVYNKVITKTAYWCSVPFPYHSLQWNTNH